MMVSKSFSHLNVLILTKLLYKTEGVGYENCITFLKSKMPSLTQFYKITKKMCVGSFGLLYDNMQVTHCFEKSMTCLILAVSTHIYLSKLSRINCRVLKYPKY